MKVLLLCDDTWHPAEIIERGLAAMDREDMEFDVVKTPKDILTMEFVRRYDALVNCHGSCLNSSNPHPWFDPGVTEFGPEEFRDYVAGGGGLTVIHSGLTIGGPNDPQPAYTDVVGSYFIIHPPRETVRVSVTAENEITRGAAGFSLRDEHYQLEITARDIEPFLQSVSEHGGTTVSGYRRRCGKGRVAVLAPGHTLQVWENAGFQTLVKNAIRWTVGK